MSPENYLLAPSKQLYLPRVLGEEREGGVLTNEATYNKNTFDASFRIMTICSMFGRFLTLNLCTIIERLKTRYTFRELTFTDFTDFRRLNILKNRIYIKVYR